MGYEDGAVKIWDLKTTACLFTFSPSPRYHESHVICMDCHTSNNLVATGSWDGTVLIINSASGQVRMFVLLLFWVNFKFFCFLSSCSPNIQYHQENQMKVKRKKKIELNRWLSLLMRGCFEVFAA